MISDLKLFWRNGAKVPEKPPQAATVDKAKSDHVTRRIHGGRIDTLGVDARGSVVIIEYKPAIAADLVKQELFWLDWLMDHRDDSEVLVQRKPGSEDVVTYYPMAGGASRPRHRL